MTIIEKKLSFEYALNSLVEEASKLSNVLDASSDRIKKIEKTLTDVKCIIPFTYKLLQEKNITHCFSWQLEEKCNKYRLMLTSINQENKDVVLCKPLIETKLEIRLKFAKFLFPFMNALSENLKKYKESLQK